MRTWGLLLPEHGLEAESRAAVARELQRANRHRVLVVASIMLVVHVALFLVFSRVGGTTAVEKRWLFWLVRIHAGMTCVVLLLVIAAVRDGRLVPFSRAWLGDVMASLYVVFGAVVSANAQRAHASLNVFVFCTLAVAIMFRARPWVFVTSLAVGCAILMAGALRFQPETSVALVNSFTTLAFGVVSLVAFCFVHGAAVREMAARFELERSKTELESRVEAQVHAIVAHAKDIDQLNAQLNEKVRLRSEELSHALARLAATGRDALAPEIGTILGERVELQSLIGSGGMGVVYRGYDRLAQTPVAVKLIQAGSARQLDDLHRFLLEARAMATVQHPAIVRLIDVDISADGRLFEVMELVEGQSLEARLRDAGPLPWTVVSRLGATLADALACAHAAGIVHRDVKPSNVMLTRTPPGLKLLDFGVAKLRDAHAFDKGDTGLRVLGTPEFMAPEQVMASGLVDDRADVYAVGGLLYYCLAGRAPFDALTAAQWMHAHLHEEAMDLDDREPTRPTALVDLVMACLRKQPHDRPASAELARALGAIADAAGIPSIEVLERARPPSAASPPEVEPTTIDSDNSTFIASLRSGGVTKKDEL